VFIIVSLALAQSPNLTYQERGAYKEGIRTMPSTFSRVDLLAARIDLAEPATTNPALYHALFFMPEQLNDLHVIVREAEQLRYLYWLDWPQDSV